MKTIVFKGGSLVDTCFTLDTAWGEEITWNITRMRADCIKGQFGVPRYTRVADLPPARWDLWGEQDRATVNWLKAHPDVLEEPGIAIGSPNPDYLLLCWADGQHRATAKQEMGALELAFYVVPWDQQAQYRVTIEEVEL